MEFTYKQIGNNDIELFHQMLDCFGEAFDEHEEYGKYRPDELYVKELLASGTFIALVALEQQRVVGALAAYVLRKFEQRRSEIYIYDLAVSNKYRRRGIATELIEKLKSLAVDYGAWVIFIQAEYGDKPAVQLYTKLGAKEEVLHFDIPVSNNE